MTQPFSWLGGLHLDEADHRDPEVWRTANPGYDDLVSPDDFESAVSAKNTGA
jgi:phage terminase large subunit-like protein